LDLWLIFVTGLAVSFHCVAMCGGMVVTYTAGDEGEEGKKISLRPHFSYFAAKLFSYTAVGATLGYFGSYLNISSSFRAGISIFVGIFMIAYGINLTGKVKWFRFLSLKPPRFLRNLLKKESESKSKKAPVFLGLLTGFMPCGPLQAMQLFAIGTGSAFYGGLSMFIFGLGTIPLMAVFAGTVSLFSQQFRTKVLRIGGVVVIVLGLVMLNRGLMLSGSKYNFNSFARAVTSEESSQDISGNLADGVQEVTLTVKGEFLPSTLVVKKNVPVRLTVKRPESKNPCTAEIVFPEYGIKKALPDNGETVIEFTPKEEGNFPFTCWMGMIPGIIKVIA